MVKLVNLVYSVFLLLKLLTPSSIHDHNAFSLIIQNFGIRCKLLWVVDKWMGKVFSKLSNTSGAMVFSKIVHPWVVP